MMCALRILFQMLADESRSVDYEPIESRLLQLVGASFEYFLSLSSEIHRESWTPSLLLIFMRILQLPTDQVLKIDSMLSTTWLEMTFSVEFPLNLPLM